MLRRLSLLVYLAALIALPVATLADSDESLGNTTAGLQPLSGMPIPAATPVPGESRSLPRADGTFQAIPEIHGKTKVFHLTERQAPWTLRPGLTVIANTYNGVVPGPTILAQQGDHIVIDITNDLDVADTLHLHGIHGTDVTMDGVAGISQLPIQPHGGRYRYAFDANQSGTFMYHSHGSEDMVDSGLYGGIIVEARSQRSEDIVSRDYLQILSSWKIQALGENHFTINGKSYPATPALDVSSGQRVRIRWVNISGENNHTMHTHGHDQLVVARDAQPLNYRDIEDTVSLGPGQRVDVIVTANAKPGTWLVHCHVLDHNEDMNSMPDGLITAIHYTGTRNTLTAMNESMLHSATHATATLPMPATSKRKPPPKSLALQITLILASIAGSAILLALPIIGVQQLPRETTLGLNVTAIAILVYLVVQIANDIAYTINHAMVTWQTDGQFPLRFTVAVLTGLLTGFIGFGAIASRPIFIRRSISDFAARTFAQGLAIGVSAVSGAVLLTLILVIGFTLHNAAKGFSIATRFRRIKVPKRQFAWLAAGLAGGPILLGTVVGYIFSAPDLSLFFLAGTSGTLMYVIGELATEILVILSCSEYTRRIQQ